VGRMRVSRAVELEGRLAPLLQQLAVVSNYDYLTTSTFHAAHNACLCSDNRHGLSMSVDSVQLKRVLLPSNTVHFSPDRHPAIPPRTLAAAVPIDAADAADQQFVGAGQQRDQQRDLHQQRDWGHADSVDSLVRALPSHISDFGESPPDEEEAAATTGAQADGAAAGAATDGPAVPPDGTEGAATHHLPSHISAFGDDLGPLPGGRAMLSAGEDADDGFAAGRWDAAWLVWAVFCSHKAVKGVSPSPDASNTCTEVT